MADDVVITGLGVISPIGCTEQAFWDGLCKGRCGAGPVKGLDTTELPRQTACQIDERIEAGSTVGRASSLAVAAARQAVSSAGLNKGAIKAARTGVTVGTTMGETQLIEERLTAGAAEWLSPEHVRRILQGVPGSIARSVQADLRIKGSAIDLYGACAAGNMAIATARRSLLDDQCDVMLAGGADGFSMLAFIGFMRLRVMAEEVCRPFDEQRDGLLVGEGAAMFVLERESSARARGAPIRARVLGASMTSECYHPTRPDPEGDGLARATQSAIAEAGVDPADVDYVCAHGTGTPWNDSVEVKVMERCFPAGVSFSSIKALTGHPMGGAAALETACCVLSIEHQTLIPTWHLTNVLPCSLDAVRDAPRTARIRCAINNSAGFGGYNSSVLLTAG